jgi:hypothetical protein
MKYLVPLGILIALFGLVRTWYMDERLTAVELKTGLRAA